MRRGPSLLAAVLVLAAARAARGDDPPPIPPADLALFEGRIADLAEIPLAWRRVADRPANERPEGLGVLGTALLAERHLRETEGLGGLEQEHPLQPLLAAGSDPAIRERADWLLALQSEVYAPADPSDGSTPEGRTLEQRSGLRTRSLTWVGAALGVLLLAAWLIGRRWGSPRP